VGLCVALAGCDLGPAQLDPGHGPALHLLASLPENGQGIRCSKGDASCGVPIDATIELSFDRPLLPATAVRQSIAVYTGSPGVGSPFLVPNYDLLERRLRFRNMGRLQPNALYQLRLPLAHSSSESGLRAFDGAGLEPDVAPNELSFVTSASLAVVPAAPAFSEPTCEQITTLLSSHCAGSCCHGGESPAMGLRLDTWSGLEQTAIEHVAHQTETGNTVGVPFSNPARFGVAMPILDPNGPATSYLIYKLLLSPANLAPCATDSCAFEALPGAQSCVPLPGAERERLAAWFVQGAAMPIVESGVSDAGCLPSDNRPLDCGEMRAITRFIEGGARCP
jgi:hypothetical protein